MMILNKKISDNALLSTKLIIFLNLSKLGHSILYIGIMWVFIKNGRKIIVK